MRSYEAARTYFSILGFAAWSVIVIGVLAALIGGGGAGTYGGSGAAIIAMMPGLGIAVAGFVLLAFVQMGRAQVDTAEYTQQMLQISRDQLEVSRQALKQGNQASKSFASVAEKDGAKKSKGFAATDFETKSPLVLKRPDLSQVQSKRLEDGQSVEYLGHEIRKIAGEYMVGGKTLFTLNLAERHIERNLRDLVYSGVEIQVNQGKYCVGEKTFETIEKVKAHIDAPMPTSSKPLPKAWNP